MKKRFFITLLSISYPLLQGCYPGWQAVKVEPSVVNKPCVLQGKMEMCKGTLFECEIWFKKRATKVGANTASFETYLGGSYVMDDTIIVNQDFHLIKSFYLLKKAICRV